MEWRSNFNNGRTKVWVQTDDGIRLDVEGCKYITFEDKLKYAKELAIKLNGLGDDIDSFYENIARYNGV